MIEQHHLIRHLIPPFAGQPAGRPCLLQKLEPKIDVQDTRKR
jgi:hypothetical protein